MCTNGKRNFVNTNVQQILSTNNCNCEWVVQKPERKRYGLTQLLFCAKIKKVKQWEVIENVCGMAQFAGGCRIGFGRPENARENCEINRTNGHNLL